MAKMLVCYCSRTKHTEHMAEVIGKAAASVAGVHVDVLPTGKVATRDLLTYDAILLGSPVFYGTMAAEMKQFIDESVVLHGQLTGKVGGAFASGGNIAGGNETTILSLLCALMIHGMIVQGTNSGDHYGPVAIGDLDERSRQQCHAYGERLARLADKLHG